MPVVAAVAIQAKRLCDQRRAEERRGHQQSGKAHREHQYHSTMSTTNTGNGQFGGAMSASLRANGKEGVQGVQATLAATSRKHNRSVSPTSESTRHSVWTKRTLLPPRRRDLGILRLSTRPRPQQHGHDRNKQTIPSRSKSHRTISQNRSHTQQQRQKAPGQYRSVQRPHSLM